MVIFQQHHASSQRAGKPAFVEKNENKLFNISIQEKSVISH